MPSASVIMKVLEMEQSRLVTLVQVEFPGQTVRYCNLEKNASGGGTYTFASLSFTCLPFLFTLEGSKNTAGELISASLLFSIIDRVISDRLNIADATGSLVTVWETMEGLTSSTDFLDKWRFRISKPPYNTKDYDAKIDLTPLNAEYKKDFPSHVRDRGRCRFKFDADGTDPIAANTCGFWTQYAHRWYPGSEGDSLSADSDYTPSISSCDKGYRSKNGCKAHFGRGYSHRTAGSDIYLPSGNTPALRFGGYPGMPMTPLKGIV